MLRRLLVGVRRRKSTPAHNPGWTGSGNDVGDVGTSRLDDELIAQKVMAERVRIFAPSTVIPIGTASQARASVLRGPF